MTIHGLASPSLRLSWVKGALLTGKFVILGVEKGSLFGRRSLTTGELSTEKTIQLMLPQMFLARRQVTGNSRK